MVSVGDSTPARTNRAIRFVTFDPRSLHDKFDCGAYAVDDAASASSNPDVEYAVQAALIKDIFGNPFRPVTFHPSWRTSAALGLARSMYESRDFAAMPVLADALQEAGCNNADILSHCRRGGPHVRGCWVVDLVLGKA